MTRVRISVLLVSVFAVGVCVVGPYASPAAVAACCGGAEDCGQEICCSAAALDLPNCDGPARSGYCVAKCPPGGGGF